MLDTAIYVLTGSLLLLCSITLLGTAYTLHRYIKQSIDWTYLHTLELHEHE